MRFIKNLFISKQKLLERLASLESYVGAECKVVQGSEYTYYEHEPNRAPWNRNPIAKLIIKEGGEK